MKLLCLTLLIANASCFYINNSTQKNEAIVGGDYSSIQDVPYQAQLVKDDAIYCGATIISEFWLVAAGHCFIDTGAIVTVVTGTSYTFPGETHEIEKVVVHPKFNFYTLDNDISLIKLLQPIRFNKNQMAIPLSSKEPKVGNIMKISGYGREGDNEGPARVVKIAYVPVVDTKICREHYQASDDDLTPSMFCAGIGDADSCRGDSGGPAVIDGELAGVISAGHECASKFLPGVYTRIHLFREWIRWNTHV